MKLQTLQRSGHELASPSEQLAILQDDSPLPCGSFAKVLRTHEIHSLRRSELRTVQVNVGRVCNQTCTHCHVDAGPDRRESMTRKTAEEILNFLAMSSATTLDITGGAPEMNPNFRFLVEGARKLGRQVIDRCNLTILVANGFHDLAEFLALHSVHVIASLPCYLEENCDRQRGQGVFGKSIQALTKLNELGYAKQETSLELDLVYNPVGPSLPPNEKELEAAYRQQLRKRFGIEFSQLLTITNMPISRYLNDLLETKKYEQYMALLCSSFNPATIPELMCRSLISVDWEGYLYDCDFNQMLDLPLGDHSQRTHISETQAASLTGRSIQINNHCFGCTAGNGSSCGGSLQAS